MARTARTYVGEQPKRSVEVGLEKLERRFARFRRNNPPRTRIPDALRREALGVAELGVSPSRLRRACGISSDQLDYWREWQGERCLAGSVEEATAQEARVFSVVGGLADEEPTPEPRQVDGERNLELRLGEWSVTVRRATTCENGD